MLEPRYWRSFCQHDRKLLRSLLHDIILTLSHKSLYHSHQYCCNMNLLSSCLLIASVIPMALAQITGTYIPLAYTVSKTPECLYERITTSEHLTGKGLHCISIALDGFHRSTPQVISSLIQVLYLSSMDPN
jgi:hypothetical protein